MSLHNVNRHVLQVWLWLLGILLALFLVSVLALQHPYWQRYAARQVTGYLAAKLKTKVTIGSFSTNWRNHFVLKDFYLEDQHQDTLLFAKNLGVDLDFPALLRNQISISDVTLERAVLLINATLPDSVYNFDFIRTAFSAPDAAEADSTVVLTYKMGDLRLDHLRVQIRDSVRGNYIQALIGHFGAQKDRFQPGAAPLHYSRLTLSHTTIHYRQTAIPGERADSLDLDFSFREMRLNTVRLDYANPVAAQQLQAAIGTAQVLADTFDLKKARIGLTKFQLNNSFISYYLGRKLNPDSLGIRPARTIAKIDRAAALATSGELPGWLVSVRKLMLRNLTLAVGNYQAPLGPQVLDVNHLQLNHLNLDLESLKYQRQRVSGRLQNLSFREKSGLQVKQLAGELQARPRQVLVRNAYIQTQNSQVSRIHQLQYGWPENDSGKPGKFLLKATLGSSLISAKDWAYLAPYLPMDSPLPEMYRHNLRLQGHIAVTDEKMRADQLRLRGLSGTYLVVSGKVTGLTKGRNTRISLQVHQLLTNRADARHLLPPGTLHPGLTLPDRLQLTGHLSGGAGALVFRQARVKTSDGAILETSGTIRSSTGPQKWMDLQVREYSTSRAALLHLLPPDAVSRELQLPDKMVFSGTFQGASLDRFRSRTTIRSSFGQATLDLAVQPGERFSGLVALSDFDLGKFLREEKVLGRATGQASFTGQGLTFATTRVRFDASIRHIIYNRAPYRNIQLNGTLDNEVYDVQGGLAKVVVQRLGNKLGKLNPAQIKRLNPTKIKRPQIRKRLWPRKKGKE